MSESERKLKLTPAEIKAIVSLDLVTKFVFLTVIRFFLHLKNQEDLVYNPGVAFSIYTFYLHSWRYCSEFKELCELHVTTGAIFRSLKILSQSQSKLLSGTLDASKVFGHYHTNLPLQQTEELLVQHISAIPSEEHKQYVLDLAFRQLEKF